MNRSAFTKCNITAFNGRFSSSVMFLPLAEFPSGVRVHGHIMDSALVAAHRCFPLLATVILTLQNKYAGYYHNAAYLANINMVGNIYSKTLECYLLTQSQQTKICHPII